jgi:hypothetical protein
VENRSPERRKHLATFFPGRASMAEDAPAMRSTTPQALLAGVLLCLSGCSEKLPLPWGTSPDPGEPAAASQADLDCDDLPALTAEEQARGPMDLSLEKGVPVEPLDPPRYAMLAGVALSLAVAAKVEQIDEAFFARTGKRLVITSGTRDAARQAKAMYKVLSLGGDIIRLYKNKAAATEIKQAYDSGRAGGKTPDDVVTAMYEAIRGQMSRGIYISAHLRAGAVDIRNRTMSQSEKKSFATSVADMEDIRMIEEFSPPHFHVQIE